MVTCSGVRACDPLIPCSCFVVGSWNIAVNLDGILLFELSFRTRPFTLLNKGQFLERRRFLLSRLRNMNINKSTKTVKTDVII